MALMEKEGAGLVFEDPTPNAQKRHRWVAVGKVCSPRPLKMSVLEKTMPRAWGLHREAKIREIGPKIISVQFGSEGDWRHVLINGPWQYDFAVLVMKDYEGDKRPSEMIFDKVDVWVRVSDLPPDKRTEVFGRALGNWLGETIKVDVDREGVARGNQLRVRTKISMIEPLVRGFYLKKKNDDQERTWFEFTYEKIPHFCFDCGRLVHANGICVPLVEYAAQWGSWLRNDSRITAPSKEGVASAPVSSGNSMGNSRVGDASDGTDQQPKVRDLPTKRNLGTEFSRSAKNCTGDKQGNCREEVRSPCKDMHSHGVSTDRDLRDELESRRKHDLRTKLMD
nr:uncharacterized protein LOC109777374 [Aegilops tauschii subsp. strangulata]